MARDNWIKVPKLGPIKANVDRPVDGKLKSITQSRTITGKHYASLLFDTDQAPLRRTWTLIPLASSD